MELRVPKRYRAGRRQRRIFGSWKWLRNLLLLLFFGWVAYWVYRHPEQLRQGAKDLRQNLNKQAKVIQETIPTQATPTPDVSNDLVAANTAYQAGDYRRAIESYYKVIKGAPNDLEAHYRLALMLIITSDLGANTEQLQEALEVATKAINADPEAPDGWTIKAMAYVWLGDYGEAIAYALRALELDPNFVQAKALLAESYWKLDRADLAQQNINEALAYLRQVGSASPETIAIVFRTQGYIAERQLERDSAIEAYQTAREAAPYQTYIALELALSYFGNGQTDLAIALLKQSLDANPRDVALMFQLGKIYVNIGDAENGRQTFQRCIEIDPNFAGCLSWLGGLQFYAGEYAQAVRNLELAIENGSKDPDDWWQLGRSHSNMLRCDLAIPIFREGYALVKGNVEQEEKFATGLRDCGAAVEAAPAAPPLPSEATPSGFFTETPPPSATP